MPRSKWKITFASVITQVLSSHPTYPTHLGTVGLKLVQDCQYIICNIWHGSWLWLDNTAVEDLPIQRGEPIHELAINVINNDLFGFDHLNVGKSKKQRMMHTQIYTAI